MGLRWACCDRFFVVGAVNVFVGAWFAAGYDFVWFWVVCGSFRFGLLWYSFTVLCLVEFGCGRVGFIVLLSFLGMTWFSDYIAWLFVLGLRGLCKFVITCSVVFLVGLV